MSNQFSKIAKELMERKAQSDLAKEKARKLNQKYGNTYGYGYAPTNRITVSGTAASMRGYSTSSNNKIDEAWDHGGSHIKIAKIAKLESQLCDMREGVKELLDFATRKQESLENITRVTKNYHRLVMEEMEEHCLAVLEENEE